MAIKILLSRKLGELRWTQADLARKTGIRPTTINEMYHEICVRVNASISDTNRSIPHLTISGTAEIMAFITPSII